MRLCPNGKQIRYIRLSNVTLWLIRWNGLIELMQPERGSDLMPSQMPDLKVWQYRGISNSPLRHGIDCDRVQLVRGGFRRWHSATLSSEWELAKRIWFARSLHKETHNEWDTMEIVGREDHVHCWGNNLPRQHSDVGLGQIQSFGFYKFCKQPTRTA